MRRDEAHQRLPEVHREVLRMRDDGRSAGEIAAHLGVEPEAVRSLIEVAQAKLARLEDEDVS